VQRHGGSLDLGFPNSMKNILITIIFAFLCLTGADAQTPQFKDYPITDIYTGRNAPVKLVTKDDKMFRTRLRELGKDKVNFAGRYIIGAIGCGAECLTFAVIDAKTGRVFHVPFSVCCWFDSESADPVEDAFYFKIDSNLIIFYGLLNEDQKRFGTYFYKFDNGKFTEIKYLPAKRNPYK
jgi:hypothetical protein